MFRLSDKRILADSSSEFIWEMLSEPVNEKRAQKRQNVNLLDYETIRVS
jgi:hypothetical protein